jgi:hypothetical protein
MGIGARSHRHRLIYREEPARFGLGKPTCSAMTFAIPSAVIGSPSRPPGIIG